MDAAPGTHRKVRRVSAADSPALSPLFLAVAVFFVTALVIANVIAVKLVEVWGHVFPAGLVVFPLTYLLGGVLTEVYGFRAARTVIWLGFGCNLIAVAAIQIAIQLPPAGFWAARQDAYVETLGMTWRIVLASFAAYLVGELTNATLIARLKVLTRGRWLWSRFIGSTAVGQALDSAVFITVAFAGTGAGLLNPIVTTWVIKVAYETLATPLTYAIVNALKRREGLDPFDTDTRLTPLPVRESGS